MDDFAIEPIAYGFVPWEQLSFRAKWLLDQKRYENEKVDVAEKTDEGAKKKHHVEEKQEYSLGSGSANTNPSKRVKKEETDSAKQTDAPAEAHDKPEVREER